MSSSESEDENLRKFAEAVDVKLFDNSFYKNDKEDLKESPKTVTQKSQRYLDEEDNVFQSELNVSENMKGFIAKKMSSLIEKEIEFVTVKHQEIKTREGKDTGVRLLKGCEQIIKIDDPVDEIIQNKIKIKRRKVEGNEDFIKESEKIVLASTDIEKIQQEIKFHDKKVRHKALNFKMASDGKSYLQEPSNDFTAARKKNNWDEAKIKNAKNFGKSLNKIL